MKAFIAGVEYCYNSRQSEIDELVSSLRQFVHLHGCEHEGIQSGAPTPQMWFDAVDSACEILKKYESC